MSKKVDPRIELAANINRKILAMFDMKQHGRNIPNIPNPLTQQAALEMGKKDLKRLRLQVKTQYNTARI